MHTLSSLTRRARLGLLASATVRMASAQPAFLTNALNFNGINQYVSVPAAAGGELNSAFTVEAWVYVRTYAVWSRLLDFGNGPASSNVVCALTEGTSGHPLMDNYDGAAFTRVQSSAALPLNTWTHLAFTADGTLGRIFINGGLVGSNLVETYSGPRLNNYLGRSNWPDAYADALFAEFRLWNVARSQAQIQGSINAALAGHESGLRLYYRFDGSGNTASNLATATGSAYDGTLVNGPARVVVTNTPLSASPLLTATRQGPTLWLTWPTNDPAFGLQFSTNLSVSNWTTINTAQTINGLSTVAPVYAFVVRSALSVPIFNQCQQCPGGACSSCTIAAAKPAPPGTTLAPAPRSPRNHARPGTGQALNPQPIFQLYYETTPRPP